MNIAAKAEEYLWNNFKFYLMVRKSCLLDLLLPIENEDKDFPVERYADFPGSLEKHIGLRSFVVGQSVQFSNTPYMTVGFDVYKDSQCSCQVVASFSVVFSVDTPNNQDQDIKYVGNSSEAVARFRRLVWDALDDIMFEAWEDNGKHYENRAFFDFLKDTAWVNPITQTGDTVAWNYNMVGNVINDSECSAVEQLKKEDRSSGLAVFTISYMIDVNKLYDSKGIGCGC